MKSNLCLLKTMAIFLIFVVKTALILLVLGGFVFVFNQSETVCSLHSCYKFALVQQKNCTSLSAANQNSVVFFVFIIRPKKNDRRFEQLPSFHVSDDINWLLGSVFYLLTTYSQY